MLFRNDQYCVYELADEAHQNVVRLSVYHATAHNSTSWKGRIAPRSVQYIQFSVDPADAAPSYPGFMVLLCSTDSATQVPLWPCIIETRIDSVTVALGLSRPTPAVGAPNEPARGSEGSARCWLPRPEREPYRVSTDPWSDGAVGVRTVELEETWKGSWRGRASAEIWIPVITTPMRALAPPANQPTVSEL